MQGRGRVCCPGIVQVLHPGEMSAPGGRAPSTNAAQSRLQILVGSLCLAIRLRVVS